MPISSLEGMNSDVASEILAEAAILSGPNLNEIGGSRYSEEVSQVLAELRSRLGIAENDRSITAQRMMDDALSEELDKISFASTDFDEVILSLGQHGNLPTSAYNISVISSMVKPSGEKEKFILRSVVEAEAVDHLDYAPWLKNPSTEQNRVSIFAKQIGKNERSHWLVTQATRVAKDLKIIAAWRVFPQVVDIRDAKSPFDLLRAFVNHYGLQICLPDRAPTKLIVDELVLDTTGYRNINNGNVPRSARVVDPQDGQKSWYVEVGALYENGAIILAAYDIDMKKYGSDKRIFGF